ncbi:MAG: family 16 glycosylhydrolase, partial [Bacteroidota bacterium]
MRKVLVVVVVLGSFACGSDEEELILSGFSIPERSVTEANVDRDFSVAITIDGTVRETSVSYRLEPDSAIPGIDYEDVSGSVAFAGGQGTVNIPIIADMHLEIMETLFIVLSYEGEEYRYALNIADDDAIGEIAEDEEGFITPDEYPSMRLVWADEFDGASLNEDNWEYELGDGCAISPDLCGWGNNELQNYTNEAENIRLQEGRLIIEALNTTEGYTSARIRTKDKYETAFGRIDIRAILPKGQGIWPAFWMLGANIDEVNWPLCGEIDIMEIVGHEP